VSVNLVDAYRGAGHYVARILKGEMLKLSSHATWYNSRRTDRYPIPIFSEALRAEWIVRTAATTRRFMVSEALRAEWIVRTAATTRRFMDSAATIGQEVEGNTEGRWPTEIQARTL
jgi:hypothetical protein